MNQFKMNNVSNKEIRHLDDELKLVNLVEHFLKKS